MSDDLWSLACAAYAAPGVAEACLSLQDYHEQNVPLLRWAAWTAATGRRPDEETIEAACDTARAWQTTTIAPLRAVRRTLKTPVPDLETDARLAVRDSDAAAEAALQPELVRLARSRDAAIGMQAFLTRTPAEFIGE